MITTESRPDDDLVHDTAVQQHPDIPSHPPAERQAPFCNHEQDYSLRANTQHQQTPHTTATQHPQITSTPDNAETIKRCYPAATPNATQRVPELGNTIQTKIASTDSNMPADDCLTAHKSTNSVRLYFQNINGVNKNNWTDWEHAAIQLQCQAIDIFGCAETNYAWTEASRKLAQHKICKTKQQAQLSVASSNDTGTSNYQPGGVASCITGKLTGRIIEQINDTSGLGRWAGHILIGKHNKHIAVITAYRPTKSTGHNTNYQQQWRILRNRDNNDPEPRSKMLKDLTETIRHWTAQQMEVILIWDANESIQHHRSQLHQFMAQTNLMPAHTASPTASYNRGSLCIDFIMTTPNTHDAIIAAGYLPLYGSIWESDHRGIFIDISIDTLFHGQTPNIHANPKRILPSNNHSQVFRFIKALDNYSQLRTTLDSIQTLNKINTWDSEQHESLERLDIELTDSLLKAESKCAMPHQADWHPALHRCYLLYRFSNNKNVTLQLSSIADKLQSINTNPPSRQPPPTCYIPTSTRKKQS
jgi:hypothetical protein